MKIFFFTKKKIGFFFCFLILLFLFFFLVSKSYSSSNVQTSNSFVSNLNFILEQKGKIAYLTFDDGPSSSVTPKILDILKEEEIKATFFVIGKSVEAHPEIIKRAYEEGHYIANHSYSHNNAILYQSKESFIQEIRQTDIAIGKAIGIDNYCSSLFRFPNGSMAPLYLEKKKEAKLVLANLHYYYIDWNCLNQDSVKKCSIYELKNNLKKSSYQKDSLVILMHDTKDVNDSSLVLKDSISYLKEKGYEFRNFYSLFSQNEFPFSFEVE